MSGGHFNYQQYRLNDMAIEIKELIAKQAEYGYSDKTIFKFREAVEYLELAATFVQRIDWLVSGDDGEETFHKRLTEELERFDD